MCAWSGRRTRRNRQGGECGCRLRAWAPPAAGSHSAESTNLEQLENNISEIKNADPLNDEELEILKEVSEIINSNITVDCTKCRYCIDACPEEIDIAKIFDLYNKDKLLGNEGWSQAGNAYLNYSNLPDVGIASDCVECEMCVEGHGRTRAQRSPQRGPARAPLYNQYQENRCNKNQNR